MSISLGMGGAERSCAMLSQLLVEQGHEIHIVILNNIVDYDYSGTLVNLGVEKEIKNTFLSRLLRIRTLRSYLKKHSFDLIIDHRTKIIFGNELFYDRYVYKGFKRAYVVHSSNPDLYLAHFPKKMKAIYNHNVFTVGVSKYITTEILEKNGIRNCHTIYNCYDPSWGKIEGEIPEILKNKKYILSYGRIEDDVKDFTFLIRSFTESDLWKRGCFLIIMGEGSDKEKLIQMVRTLPSAKQILFLPFTKDPISIIKNAHFVTLTSQFEGFPMVLVESLSLGVPVVSLDIISGPSEIIKHEENGLLISKRSLPLFSEALKQMCTDEKLHNHCADNAKKSVRAFSKENIAQQWQELLEDELH